MSCLHKQQLTRVVTAAGLGAGHLQPEHLNAITAAAGQAEKYLLGIEDAELLRYWHPAVTVVDTAPERLGELAIAAMLAQLRHETPPTTEFVIETNLIERASVRDLPA